MDASISCTLSIHAVYTHSSKISKSYALHHKITYESTNLRQCPPRRVPVTIAKKKGTSQARTVDGCVEKYNIQSCFIINFASLS